MGIDFSSLLNDRQREAIESTDGPLLILAGAGSGKTRVITYRIARLLEKGVPQSEILAVTFTNKAAREMGQRIRSVIPRKLSRLTISTFHSFGAQVLRDKGGILGYRPGFSIYDTQDQVSLLKETARELGMKTDAFDFESLASYFSGIKTGRKKWRQSDKDIRPLYKEYLKGLKLSNAVDFDDLIVLPTGLLGSNPEVRAEYEERYRYVLVDEFQDTSANQYELVRLIAASHGNICVVGDDDQSIYSWRGANFENIRRFETDFPAAREIKLEQNYRSTRTILRAANALISHNQNRKPKELWSGLAEGELLEVAFPEDEAREAELIASRIRAYAIRDSLHFQDFAVLVRANHLTRAIEEVFRKERIPYQISGGTSFFDRQEVRDVLAYLRVIANHDDDTSLLRIVNTPRRGLGRKLLEHSLRLASERSCSLFSALASAAASDGGGMEEKARGLVVEFLELVGRSRERFFSGGRMSDALKTLVDEIDYWGHIVGETKDKEAARWKFGNVESLVSSLAQFEDDPDAVRPDLYDYLRSVSLASRDDLEDRDSGGRVNVMTIHAAKGLEFPVVFVAGVEQGIIPHAKSVEEANADEEEERRLFYVALTRARRRLILTSCASRRRMGKPSPASPSPFLDELPQECLAPQAAEQSLSEEEAARLFADARRRFSGTDAPKVDAPK
jgi:DNA helicase II / ATP-dependent DNA helicase PcrA